MKIRKTGYFEKWYKRLKNREARGLITKRLRRIEIDGNLGDFSTISKNVSEFRFDIGPGYRVYFAKKRTALVILLLGGNKSTQKRDIRKAERIAEAVLEEIEQ